MKKICKIVCYTLVFSSLLLASWSVASLDDTAAPEWKNQDQNKTIIRSGENITLYAQGKDNVALDHAYLATNETGEWRTFSGIQDWPYCKQLVINYTLVEADLINFPVLITYTSPDFAPHAQPDADDFIFVDSTTTIRYNHEIEYYNSATGELAAWVNIPLLSSKKDTVLYMYYGNPGCGNQQNVAGTWDSNFIMIDHLTGATTADLKDSSANHWDVTSSGGSPSYNQVGKAGRCVDFDGVDDSLQTNLFRLPTDSSYTAGAWVYVDGNAGMRRYIFEGVSTNLAISLLVWTNETFKNFAKTDSGGATASSYSTTQVDVANPQWYYVCTRVNTATDDLELFVNGLMERNVPITGLVNPEPSGLNIGTSQNAPNSWMNGKIDEIRISNVSRSDAWIKTEYTMMNSPTLFLTVKNYSPLKMQENDQWQWSNFTWQNPEIVQGIVGWRIYYEDTNGNTIMTDIKSFTVVETNSPPVRPGSPSGSNTGVVEEEYVYTVNPVTDRESDDIAFLFDWGDGNTSGWTEYVSSGSGMSKSYTWGATGSFGIKVKAKDRYGLESDWSPILVVTIAPSPGQVLRIDVPSSVREASSFQMNIMTNAGTPVEGARVEVFNKIYYGMSGGIINLSAPVVEQNTEYAMVASKEGYVSATAMITVLNDENVAQQGWIYGKISDESWDSISDAKICVFATGMESTQKCVFTDLQGRYYLLVPVGTYTVEVTKQGYETYTKHDITVGEHEAIGVNVVLKSVENASGGTKEEIIDYAIQYGIKEGIIGGEITLTKIQPSTVTVYDTRVNIEIPSITETGVFQFTVAGPNATNGTVIAIRIDYPENVLNKKVMDLKEIVVTYDGKPIKMAASSGDIFRPMSHDEQPMWAGLLTEKLYILVSVPSFSEHEITIHAEEIIPVIGGIVVVLLYCSMIILGGVLFFSPMLADIIRRRRIIHNKK